jgi:hypothetical protein
VRKDGDRLTRVDDVRHPTSVSLGTVVFVILVLTVPLAALAEEEDVDFYYKGYTEKVDKVLGPGSAGVPVMFWYDGDGSQMLLWGRENEDDLRIMDDNLSTVAVLEPPYEEFSVKGASMAHTGRWAIAWGRTPSNTTDVLAVWDLMTYDLDRTFLHEVAEPIVHIDGLDLLANDMILAVAGKDNGGASRLVFIETASRTNLKVDPIPGNGTVVDIVHDGVKMLVLLDDGGLLMYSTYNWILEGVHQVFEGPFTAYEVKESSYWHFGNEDGVVVEMDFSGAFSFSNNSLSNGPVQAIFSIDRGLPLVVAVPEDGSTTRLEVWRVELWRREPKGWVMQSSSIIDGTVTRIAGYPDGDGTFAVGLSDGSIEIHRLVVFKEPIPREEPTWGDKYGRNALWFVPIPIIAVALIFLRMRRQNPEG